MYYKYIDGHKFIFIKSPRKDKKYRVFDSNNNYVDFGAIRKNGVPYEQFEDKISNLYSKYNHFDKKRRQLYFLRNPFDYPKFSADWWSKKYLW